MNVASSAVLVREGWRTVLNLVLLILSIVFVLEVLFHLIAAPNLRIHHVEIRGPHPVSEAQILESLGLRTQEYYFSVDEKSVLAKLSALPWVAQAEVNKVFPDRLVLVVKPREALVLTLAAGRVMALDAEGVVFDVRTSSTGWDLPIVSGLTFASHEAGGRVPEALRPLFRQLSELRSVSPALFQSLSELDVRKNDRGSFDVVIYPVGTPVRVILGDTWNAQVLQQMFVLLDLVKKQGWTAKTKEIDFRTTPVVLRPRES